MSVRSRKALSCSGSEVEYICDGRDAAELHRCAWVQKSALRLSRIAGRTINIASSGVDELHKIRLYVSET